MWTALALGLACQLIKLLFRARAWQNILKASYPEGGLKYRSALGDASIVSGACASMAS